MNAAATPEVNIQLLRNLQLALDENLIGCQFWPMMDQAKPDRPAFWLQASIKTSSGTPILHQNLIKLAKATGLELKLDRWLAGQTQKLLKPLRRTEPDTLMFVPLSDGALQDPKFADWLNRQQLLQDVTNDGVVLSFRLSEVSRNIASSTRLFSQLHETGARVCLHRFPEHDIALKLLRVMKLSFIALNPRLLTADPGAISTIRQALDKAGCKLILTDIQDLHQVSLDWAGNADILFGPAIQNLITQTDFHFPACLTALR